MSSLVSVVIPAWNEEQAIEATLSAVCRSRLLASQLFGSRVQLIVVDDGSVDGTRRAALPWADVVLRLPFNAGKGAALSAGWKAAAGDVVVCLDADLGETAAHFVKLLEPLMAGSCDMATARLPAPSVRGGFGLVRRLAGAGAYRLSGYRGTALLSGQRAIRSELLRRLSRSYSGFGIEVGMTVDAAVLGYRLAEVEVPFRHRETGRQLRDWMHRGRQFYAVGRTLIDCWRRPICR